MTTAGDVVKYTPTMPLAPFNWVGGQPLDATVTAVHGGFVDLEVTDVDGARHAITAVPLLQPGDPQSSSGNFAQA